MSFMERSDKHVVDVTIPISVSLYSNRKIEVEVSYWIRQKTLSLFWGLIVFRTVEKGNNLKKILKEPRFNTVSLKEIDSLSTKVKIAELELKLTYLDYWYSAF